MKSRKDHNLPHGVTWKEIEKGLSQGKWEYLHKMMNRSMFKHIIDEKNKIRAVNKVLKSLQKTDPQNATVPYAEKMLRWMQKYANLVLKKPNALPR